MNILASQELQYYTIIKGPLMLYQLRSIVDIVYLVYFNFYLRIFLKVIIILFNFQAEPTENGM